MSSDTWRRFELLLSETSSVIIFIGLAIKMLPGMLCMPCNKCHRQGREKWTDVLYTFATCTFLHGRSPSFKLCPLKKLEKEEATAVAIEREREKKVESTLAGVVGWPSAFCCLLWDIFFLSRANDRREIVDPASIQLWKRIVNWSRKEKRAQN